MNCSALILTYNGLEHLKICVPSLLKAVESVPHCPVVVVDNQSTDGSIEWLREKFPQVEAVVAGRNDYLFSLNAVVASREEDIVIVLNNDMRFDRGFISALLKHFERDDVFAVTARVFDWAGRQNTTGQRVGEVRKFWFCKHWLHKVTEPCLTLDAGGGCAAFRRDMFLELGGFDSLYRPAYCEDTDLSYRAWKRGWKVIYEPASVIYHRIGATWDKGKGGRVAVERLIHRNEVLFTLRNVGGWGFALGYLGLLPIRMMKNALIGNHAFWQGAFQALPKMPLALLRRWNDWRTCRRKDDDFLAEIRQELGEVRNDTDEKAEYSLPC